MKLIISISTRADAGFEAITYQSIDIPLAENISTEEKLAIAKARAAAFVSANIPQALQNHELASQTEDAKEA